MREWDGCFNDDRATNAKRMFKLDIGRMKFFLTLILLGPDNAELT